jgi:glycosyltransferase involved in cell wall biosynthesis/predicted metal-dependent phosphoesterase TrpH
MHVHSTASRYSKLGVQRSLGLPECATPPEQVYELAKRRGMDFVTITDHDTIAGCVELDHLDDTFVSEELTVWFGGEPQAVHVLCYGITPDDHDWLQAHNDDVEECAAYLAENDVACALAHPFYAVEAPLTARHRRRLAELFPIWETRNGSRAKELNLPAFIYIETHGGTGIGGTDDHAGVDIGRTYTQTPAAATPVDFLAHVRAGRASGHGEQGSAAKWAHSAMALAIRSIGRGEGGSASDPAAVLRIVERLLREGDVRHGTAAGDLGPEDARGLLRAWLAGVELDVCDEHELLALMQGEDFSHSDLARRARRLHERKLAGAVDGIVGMFAPGGRIDAGGAAGGLFDACMPVIPYAVATSFLGREKSKLTRSEGDRPRVALVADGLGGMHGVTHTLDEIRDRGVPGFDVEVIGTDANVDRRLSAVAEVEIPYYPGLKVGVPSLPAIVETLADGRYDLVHLCSPGPSGLAAWLLARVMELPVVGSYHTELGAYAGLRSGLPGLEAMTDVALGAFYGACRVTLSPSPSSDLRLVELGVPGERIARWDRGVDVDRFDPRKRVAGLLPGVVNVLYAGRLTREKGIDLLAESFLAARAIDLRLHLVLAGGGPEEGALRDRLGEHATFVGWLAGEDLARTYASADVFLFASRTDTFGQVVLEAQASGLPVVAVAEGGPTGLISHGVTGLLAPAAAGALAAAVVELAHNTLLRERLIRSALAGVAGATWEASLGRLADGYRLALGETASRRGLVAA